LKRSPPKSARALYRNYFLLLGRSTTRSPRF
jgi:hypothetical protein